MNYTCQKKKKKSVLRWQLFIHEKVQSKDERGTPDCWESLDWTVQPRKNSDHVAVFCLIWGMVWSRIQGTDWVENGVVVSWCVFFFFFFFTVQAAWLNFDSSAMILYKY